MTAADRRPLVLHVVHSFRIGGLENGMVNLINRMDARRYRHAIVCLDDYDDFARRLDGDEVKLYSLHRRQGQDFGMYWRIWKLFRELRPSIVHTRNLATIETQFFAFLAGVPRRVHGEHGWNDADPRGEVSKYQWLRRFLRPFIHHFIALSGEIESYLINKVRVAPEHISRICNGVDVERFSARGEPVNFPGFPADAVVIGAVGRLDVVKDPMNLVQAFLLLLARRPELRSTLRLVWIGDGEQRAAMEAALHDAEAEDLAWLPGARDDVPALLNGFDICVLPSRAEGISNTLLEAMATGLPVVATDVGGNHELVEDGVSARLVPARDSAALAEAIDVYVREPAARLQHGRLNAQRCVDHFSMDRMVQEYTRVYDTLLSAG